ncbi:hypothetical protein DSO57_1015154 [Entomophthora muscae]|uniref:Uncharacterized protein n=1 Tax=Entomophthora muscae TaxID=34485 RepID=A0ACC2UR29_9FUNG|nr:hypothetical protein DSO57_1015154 [Entomophthora muscae]
MTVKPPTPPPDNCTQSETKIWEAIAELKATNCHQASTSNPPPAESVPDPCITICDRTTVTIEYLAK